MSSSEENKLESNNDEEISKNGSNEGYRREEIDKSCSSPAMIENPSEGGDDEVDTGKGLKRSLTLTNSVTMIVGGMIGSGIFVAPTGVQQSAGSVGSSLLIWVLCGLWCGLGAYIYAELGTLIPKSGGDYAYLMEAFGPSIAFLRFWIESMVVRSCARAIIGLTFAVYMLRPLYPNCDPPSGATELLACSLIIALGAVNCASVKAATKVQDYFTYAKVIVLTIVILTGTFYLIFGGSQYKDSFDNIFEGNFRNLYQGSVGFYSGLFAYQGWTNLNFITEEIINPRRNLPLALMYSSIIVTVIYTLFNVALYVVISPEEMLLSPAVAVLFAEKTFPKFAFIMPLCVAISCVGTANGNLIMSSRLLFCAGREGQMPAVLAMINKKLRTPVPAVMFACFMSICYLLVSNNLYVLITASQVTSWLAFTVVALGLFRLRWKYPEASRPVKVNLVFAAIFVIGSSAVVVLPIIGSPVDSAIGLVVLFSAVPIYVMIVKNRKLPTFVAKITSKFTVSCQKLLMVVDDNDYK